MEFLVGSSNTLHNLENVFLGQFEVTSHVCEIILIVRLVLRLLWLLWKSWSPQKWLRIGSFSLPKGFLTENPLKIMFFDDFFKVVISVIKPYLRYVKVLQGIKKVIPGVRTHFSTFTDERSIQTFSNQNYPRFVYFIFLDDFGSKMFVWTAHP